MQMQSRFPGQQDEVSRWAQTHVFGIDKDAVAVKLTKAIMQIAGDGSANCVRGDSVRTHQWASYYRELTGGGFDMAASPWL
jgi:type I restriction enzyme M protein